MYHGCTTGEGLDFWLILSGPQHAASVQLTEACRPHPVDTLRSNLKRTDVLSSADQSADRRHLASSERREYQKFGIVVRTRNTSVTALRKKFRQHAITTGKSAAQQAMIVQVMRSSCRNALILPSLSQSQALTAQLAQLCMLAAC